VDFLQLNAADLFKRTCPDGFPLVRTMPTNVTIKKGFDVVGFGTKRLTAAMKTMKDPKLMHIAAMELLAFEKQVI
jgi:hypothetical protein